MCVGVAIQARIGRLVYGCPDPKAGAAGSLYDLPRDRRLNHRMEVTAGVAAEASRELLRGFFRARRAS
jgi:tRNA(adenine34) deaminase